MGRRGSLRQAAPEKSRVVGRRLMSVAVAAAALFVPVSNAAGDEPGAGLAGHHQLAPDFGPNVTIFDPSMPTAVIQATFDVIFALQRDNEMGRDRYSLLFLPGEYGSADEPLQVAVGYYTEVAGLGASPGDVRINGKIEAFNRCFDAPDRPNYDLSNPDVQCFALNNFWRSLSNLTINVNGAGQGGCEASANFWAVSQAASMRRVQVDGGNLSLMDYCGRGPYFASGGFIADTKAGHARRNVIMFD